MLTLAHLLLYENNDYVITSLPKNISISQCYKKLFWKVRNSVLRKSHCVLWKSNKGRDEGLVAQTWGPEFWSPPGRADVLSLISTCPCGGQGWRHSNEHREGWGWASVLGAVIRSWRLGELCGRRGRNTESRARGDGGFEEAASSCHNRIDERSETVAACTGPAQVQARWGLSTERQRWARDLSPVVCVPTGVYKQTTHTSQPSNDCGGPQKSETREL